MRLPPGPGRCRQRAAADAARFPESFRARRALLETYPDPARLREPPSADRDVPPPARDTCGACPASSPAQKPPPTAHSAPHRPEVPFHAGRTIPPRADRMFHPLSAGHAPHGGSLPCAGTGTKKRDGSPHSTQGQAQKNGTAAHTLRRGRHKKTGRQPTLGPARGIGYRDASSCRRPAICGKISAQITHRTGTARQPGQPVVQI